MTAPLVASSIAALRDYLSTRSGPVGLVPTMGALHEGHVTLIDAARAECGTVVVSIFVNPLQFDREDDLQHYPRTLESDVRVCSEHGVDVIFAPTVEAMYPQPPSCRVVVGALAEHLCGQFRPGHFNGVATVVLKLLEIVRPARAYFGEKDAQQLAIIRRLVEDFNVAVTIVGVPTVREADGLALSSRNVHLGPEERAAAPALYRALSEARRAIEQGKRETRSIVRDARASLAREGRIRLEYFEIVDPHTLQPVEEVTGPVLIAAAAWLGSTRLIDNVQA
jgi:pantoate--beta-alanine ligase